MLSVDCGSPWHLDPESSKSHKLELFAMKIEGKRGFLASLQAVVWVCGSLTSSDSHGRSARLYVFAKYIQSVDGGNLAPLLQRRFFTAPYPLLNIGIENLQKQICSNDGNLAPPQTERLSMLTRGCGDAASSHRRCLLCRWCKISSIHSPSYGV